MTVSCRNSSRATRCGPKIRAQADTRRRSTERREIAATVLTDLRRWFGRPDATQRYIRDSAALPMIVAKSDSGSTMGFATLRRVSQATQEIYVMGVVERYHRKGVGRSLIAEAAALARAKGASLLTVKTVGPSHPDEAYAATRKFYCAIGFRPIEELPDFWGPGMPCLILVKPIPIGQESSSGQ